MNEFDSFIVESYMNRMNRVSHHNYQSLLGSFAELMIISAKICRYTDVFDNMIDSDADFLTSLNSMNVSFFTYL